MPLEYMVILFIFFRFLVNIFVVDFDGDDMLGYSDLKQVVEKLIGDNRLSESEMQLLINNILEEADLDDDRALSFAEFEHIIDRSSDFLKYNK